MIKQWWLPVLFAVTIILVCGFWFLTRPLISSQQAFRTASRAIKELNSKSGIQFYSSSLVWYHDGGLFAPHRVYIVTGRDRTQPTAVSYVQALVDARNSKVIAIYNIHFPYMNMFSGLSVSRSEESAQYYSKLKSAN